MKTFFAVVFLSIASFAQSPTSLSPFDLRQGWAVGSPVNAWQIVKFDSIGRVVPIAAGDTARAAGVAADGSSFPGSIPVVIMGNAQTLVDNSCLVGQFVNYSATVAGSGSCSASPNNPTIGVVTQLVKPGLVYVHISPTASAGGGPLLFSGVPTGTCTAAQTAINTTNGDFYSCNSGIWNKVNGGSVGPGTTGFIPSFATSTTVGNSHCDDGVTTASTVHCSENVETTGSLTIGVGGSTAGLDALGGNTSNPSLPSNAAGFLGPASASFTSYFGQFPSTAPVAHSVMIWPAPTSNVAAFSFKAISDCQDTAGNHLNYTQSTDVFSCGTTSSGGGSGVDPLDRTTLAFRDDFLASTVSSALTVTGDYGWASFALSGALTVSRIAGTYPHLGQVRIQGASTTTGNGSAIAIGNAGNGVSTFDKLSTHTFDSVWVVRPANTTNGQYLVGFQDHDNVFETNGCYVKYDTTNSDTAWIAICEQSSTPTTVSLVTAPSTTNWSTIRIYSTVAGTTNFAVCNGDGCTLPTSGTGFASISTNTAATLLDFVAMAINANSTQATLDIDLAAFKLTSIGR